MNRKKHNYYSLEVTLLEKRHKQQLRGAFVLFQETTCSWQHQLNNINFSKSWLDTPEEKQNGKK